MGQLLCYNNVVSAHCQSDNKKVVDYIKIVDFIYQKLYSRGNYDR